ncbi:MAG: hypothetical protein OEX02_08710 [Cyclobacteriaceae bacterium]|nr:hypothetical protein [Cyclobacteriaceae bacterium]
MAFVLLLLSINSCTVPVSIPGFDSDEWKRDKHGCLSLRPKQRPVLETNKSQLKQLTSEQIIQLLGKPERQELYSRSQTFYFYAISPDEKCNDRDKTTDNNAYLQVRFNALGKSDEIIFMD